MDGKSRDLTADNIEKIKALFPEAVTEVSDKDEKVSYRVDMEKLSILLGDAAIPTDEIEYRQKYGEKFTFEWSGKRMAIAEAQKRSTGTLRPCPEESVDWDNTENLYIEGDNLEVLKLLQNSYLGAIKMIYIDPPYNTGKDFVYKDNYKDNLLNYLEQTNTTNAVNSEASGRYHTNWLNMMYPRLKLACNLMAEDGVIFISIDDNEVANLRRVCDEILGEESFVAQFPWRKRTAKSDVPFGVSQDYEWILCYAKNSFKAGIESNSRKYFETEDFPNRPWRFHDMTTQRTASERPNSNFTIVNPKNGDKYPVNPNAVWRITEEGFPNYLDENRIIFPGDYNFLKISKPVLRYWQEDDKAKSGDDFGKIAVSTKMPDYVGMSQHGTKEISELFDAKAFSYPKPIGLIKFLTQIAVKKDAIILDFFSGSATTAHAVAQLNAEDGGHRKYIMVQLPEVIEDGTSKYKTICEIGKERIRRAGKKMFEEQGVLHKELFSGKKKPDMGFKVFKLNRSNVKNWDVEFDGLNEQKAATQLKMEFNQVLNILKRERTELDMLYEVMLKLGIMLTTKVEEREVDGKKVFVVGHGVMVATFAKNLSYKQIGQMLDMKSDFVNAGEFKFVIADESFANSNDKTNALQLFKQRGITNYEII